MFKDANLHKYKLIIILKKPSETVQKKEIKLGFRTPEPQPQPCVWRDFGQIRYSSWFSLCENRKLCKVLQMRAASDTTVLFIARHADKGRTAASSQLSPYQH